MPPWLRGTGPGLGHRRVLDAAGLDAGAHRPRGGAGKQSGRTQEIQRLIGRSLRAVTDLATMGEVQITVDCDVLQADGGTRTASICGGYVALHDACSRLVAAKNDGARIPSPTRARAISVGIVDALAVPRPRLLRRRARRGRHERRDDRRGPVRRGAGHRRGLAVLAGRARRPARPRRAAASREIFDLQREMLSREPPAPRAASTP